MNKRVIALVCTTAFLILTPLLMVADAMAEEPLRELRASITIEGDDQFTEDNGVTGGTGARDDPYVIDGWCVVTDTDVGVWIRNTTSHFVVSNLTLDGDYDIAVVLDNTTNCTVQDCYFADYSAMGILARCPAVEGQGQIQIVRNTFRLLEIGVEMWDVNGSCIQENTFNDVWDKGIILHGCARSTVSHNIVNELDGVSDVPQIQSSGILFERCSQVLCEGIRMTNIRDAHGITIDNTTEATVSNSHFGYGHGGVSSIRIACSSAVLIENCTFRAGSGLNHIRSVLSNQIVIRNNELWRPGYAAGVVALGTTDVLIEANRFNGCGVYLGDVEDCLAARNLFLNQENDLYSYYYGDAKVEARDVANLSMEGNLIIGADDSGIWINEGSFVNITGNVVSEGKTSYYSQTIGLGLTLYGIDNLTLKLNRIGDNFAEQNHYYYDNEVQISRCIDVMIQENMFSNDSLLMRETSDAVIRWNTFSGNNEIGVLYSQDSVVYGNNLINGYLADFSDSDTVLLDDGYPTGGNHWSAFAGDDLFSGPDQDEPGSDGIIDMPFSVGEATDSYPLVNAVPVVDEDPPMTVAQLVEQPAIYYGWSSSDWFSANVSVELTPYDSLSGTVGTYYRIDGGEWLQYETVFNVTSDGRHTLEFYSTDALDNLEEVVTKRVWIDKVSPVIDGVDPPTNSTITKDARIVSITVHDDMSGLAFMMTGSPEHTYWYWLKADYSVEVTKPSRYDTTTIYITVYDEAGNGVVLMLDYAFDTDVYSITGPYGPWFIAAVAADFVLLMVPIAFAIQWYLDVMDLRIGRNRRQRQPGTPKGPETKEDIEDGYPKFMRKI